MIDKSRSGRGFTLFELLLVLAIVAAAMAVALPSISAGVGSIAARSTAIEISSLISKAREKAVRERVTYFADVTEHALVIRAAGGQASERRFADEIKLEPVTSISFLPNGITSGGKVKLSSKNRIFTITVFANGRTRVEASE